MNTLQQLKTYTKVVADTGDFESMIKFKPVDATTNPSLIYKSAQDPKYHHLIDDAVEYAKSKSDNKTEQVNICLDKLAVNFGLEILKIVPGRVSTEVDARLSFDTEKTVAKARELIALYEQAGIDKNRVLIKIASSPFVGRIYDWYKKHLGVDDIAPEEDPGVLSVTSIYNYYKKFNYKTEIMGASFRNTGEITHLAGCDLLTISPALLEQLENSEENISAVLTQKKAIASEEKKNSLDEKSFRWAFNENAMATEKTAEGIRKFSADLRKLENYIAEKM